MTLYDLVFLASVLFVLVIVTRMTVSAIRGRWKTVSRSSRFLGLFLVLYAVILMASSLVRPRRFYAPGERRCFDDWCAAALSASAAATLPCGPADGERDWVATIEVSSTARRIRQRAPDAHAELEDEHGKRYQPCAAPPKPLSDELGPGESFRVFLPFRLPRGATPAGLVLHHGDFPGIVIIGADQSFLHPPALQRLTVDRQP